MQFRRNTRLADIIHSNYLLLPVLNRFNVQLGFGDKTVDEVCTEQRLNTDFFLVIVNSFHDHDYFPLEQLVSFPINLIIDYVRKSHSYYLDFKVPQIEKLIQTLSANAAEEQKKQLKLIERFFSEYKTELVDHIREEENAVYPYVLSIDEAFRENRITPEHIHLIQQNSISIYAGKHDNVEDKLYDLKNILIKYLPPVDDYVLSNALLTELFRLEQDLNDHARIEDKVLFPKVQFIESKILSSIK
jgi:regulator of cell morphogenesis and NO signaling